MRCTTYAHVHASQCVCVLLCDFTFILSLPFFAFSFNWCDAAHQKRESWGQIQTMIHIMINAQVNDCFIVSWSPIYLATWMVVHSTHFLNMSMIPNLANGSVDLTDLQISRSLAGLGGCFTPFFHFVIFVLYFVFTLKKKSIFCTNGAKYVIKLCNCIEMMMSLVINKQFNYNSLPYTKCANTVESEIEKWNNWNCLLPFRSVFIRQFVLERGRYKKLFWISHFHFPIFDFSLFSLFYSVAMIAAFYNFNSSPLQTDNPFVLTSVAHIFISISYAYMIYIIYRQIPMIRIKIVMRSWKSEVQECFLSHTNIHLEFRFKIHVWPGVLFSNLQFANCQTRWMCAFFYSGRFGEMKLRKVENFVYPHNSDAMYKKICFLLCWIAYVYFFFLFWLNRYFHLGCLASAKRNYGVVCFPFVRVQKNCKFSDERFLSVSGICL